MIRKFYRDKKEPGWQWDAKAQKYFSWGYDIRLKVGEQRGKRLRESGFSSRAEAETAVGLIRKGEKERKYGFIPEAAKPTLADLVAKRLPTIKHPQERTRVARAFYGCLRVREDGRKEYIGDGLLSFFPTGVKVDAITTAKIEEWVEKRLNKDKVEAQSIDRELNAIAATLNSAKIFYPVLAQWSPPSMPRPKYPRGRRERIIKDEERETLLKYLLRPKDPFERSYQAEARRRVGLKMQFSLLTGMRHGEMNKLKKQQIDWAGRTLKIIGTKIEMRVNPVRYLNLTPTMIAILREFADASETEYVFTRAGNETPKFYRILRQACEECGILYGRDVEGGLLQRDARHTVTTKLLHAGVDLSTIQTVTGHTDKTMVLYYGHGTPETKARAAAVLEAFAGASADKDTADHLSDEQLEQLAAAVEARRISVPQLYRIMRGEEQMPAES